MKKAFLFLANGFEDVEALTPIDYLRRAGIDLITVGVGGKTIVSSHKVPITCDIVSKEKYKQGRCVRLSPTAIQTEALPHHISTTDIHL